MVKRIEEQAAARRKEIYRSHIGSVEDALDKNFKLGVVAGLMAATQLPQKLMEIEREAFNQLLENERNGSQ